jgi:histidinol phosphatase-like PHP family hydrolase
MNDHALPANRVIAELLIRASHTAETDQRRRALRRASRSALMWPVEAAELQRQGAPLTSLPQVGPWVASQITRLATGEAAEPPPLRRGFLAWSDVTVLASRFAGVVRGDLQAHTLWTDGHSTTSDMLEAAAERGHEYLLVTDHSEGLAIARGLSPERLAEQWREFSELDGRFPLRILRGIEMNLDESGAGDMPDHALRPLAVILGAFHSKLRVKEDQTERYLAALRNPWVDILAHPRGRMYDRRFGLHADWRRVFAEAARLDKAVEADGYPARQDLDVDLLRLAAETGARVSFGSDAHHVVDLPYITFSVGAAVAAGVAAERVINCLPADELAAWAAQHRRVTAL